MIQKIVEKVLVTKNGIEIHFHAGKMHYSRELEAAASGSRLILCPESEQSNALELRPQQGALAKYRAQGEKNH